MTLFIWSVFSIPNILVYRVVSGLCRQTSITFNVYTAFFLNPILYGLLPVSVLVLFGYSTYVNIHQLTCRQQRNRETIEGQLTKAIILQCASFTFSQISVLIFVLNKMRKELLSL
jgi:hypothetical protein